MIQTKKAYREQLAECGYCKTVKCTDEENAKYSGMAKADLPDDIVRSDDENYPGYYRRLDPELTGEEIKLSLLIRQFQQLQSIKYCAVFFVVLFLLWFCIYFFLHFIVH
jgi:hypothetical protein